MSTRVGMRIGPFYFSQRLGRTQAQKAAAAKARQAREAHPRVVTHDGTVTGFADGKILVCIPDVLSRTVTLAVPPAKETAGLKEGQAVRVRYRARDMKLLDCRRLRA